MRRAIPPAGATLTLLPTYAPDRNWNELLFSRINHWLRHAAARTRDALSPKPSKASPPPHAPTRSPTRGYART